MKGGREKWGIKRGCETEWKTEAINPLHCVPRCINMESKKWVPSTSEAVRSNRSKEAAPCTSLKSRYDDPRKLFFLSFGGSGPGLIFIEIFENAFTYPRIRLLGRAVSNVSERSVHEENCDCRDHGQPQNRLHYCVLPCLALVSPIESLFSGQTFFTSA